MNDLFILVNRSSNGFGLAVIGVAPGSNPFGPLRGWFHDTNIKNPDHQVTLYEVAGRLDGATDREGVIAVAEWFDQELHTGGPAWNSI